MRENSSRLRRRAAAAVPVVLTLAALVAATTLALAQGAPGATGVPIWRQPRQAAAATPPAPPAPAAPAPAPPASPAIARVAGRPITQDDYDRLAQPYFARLRQQLGGGFNADVEKYAAFNVLDELVRRELLAVAVQKQGITATPADVDAFLQSEPMFQTNGKFDPAKLAAFKSSPQSNYLALQPKLREIAAMSKLDASLRKRFTPAPATLRAEWAKSSEQVRVKLLPLMLRDMSLDPETGEAEWADYFHAHSEQFMRRTRVDLRYARFTLPPDDSAQAPARRSVLARAEAMADSLRSGALADTLPEFAATGFFEIPAPMIPGMGRVPALADSLAKADADSTARVVGVFPSGDAVFVIRQHAREGRHLPPLRDVLGDVRRRADAEKRRTAAEADRRAFYVAHAERWRSPRVTLTRVVLDTGALAPGDPAPRDVEGWWAQHGRNLAGLPAGATLPPLDDSLRALARAGLTTERRTAQATAGMTKLVAALRTGRDVRAAAKGSPAVVETLSVCAAGPRDSLFGAELVDSLAKTALARRGAVDGPRTFGRQWAAWRIESADTTFVPAYEIVRMRADAAFTEDRAAKDEANGRAWYDAHRADYKSPVRYALDAIVVKVPAPDSVRVADSEVHARYEANLKQYHRDEEVKARHILFMARDGNPEVDRTAKARAESLLAAIRTNGGDFAELAKRFSQEPGAATSGGDLGWFGRGRMVREFEDAAFALQAGQTSGVVKTQFGYHIIHVEDRHAAGTRPFDEVRAGIRTDIAQARGDSLGKTNAAALSAALARGGVAAALAAPLGGITPLPAVAPNEPLPGLGIVQGLSADLPGMAVGAWGTHSYRVTNGYALLRVREKQAEHPAEFAEVKTQAIEDEKNSRRHALLDQRVAAIRGALLAGGSLDSLAAPWGGLRDSGPLQHTAQFVPGLGSAPRVLERAFALQPGQVSDTLQVAAGVAWLRVEEHTHADDAAFRAMLPQLQAEQAKKGYDAWVEQQKKTTRVEILRADLRGPRPVLPPPATMQR